MTVHSIFLCGITNFSQNVCKFESHLNFHSTQKSQLLKLDVNYTRIYILFLKKQILYIIRAKALYAKLNRVDLREQKDKEADRLYFIEEIYNRILHYQRV